MDNRIAEVEQMITDCNAHALAQRQLSARSVKSWKSLLRAIQKIQKAVGDTPPKVAEEPAPQAKAKIAMKPEEQFNLKKETKIQVQTPSIPVPVCKKCGEPLMAGVKFCKHCGTRADVAAFSIPQPTPAKHCACGERIVIGAKFCRKCGKPV